MLNSSTKAQLYADMLIRLPHDVFYPELSGVFKHAIYPPVSDLGLLEQSKKLTNTYAELYHENEVAINNGSSSESAMASAIALHAKLNASEKMNNQASELIKDLLVENVSIIEEDIIPVIKQTDEDFSIFRHKLMTKPDANFDIVKHAYFKVLDDGIISESVLSDSIYTGSETVDTTDAIISESIITEIIERSHIPEVYKELYHMVKSDDEWLKDLTKAMGGYQVRSFTIKGMALLLLAFLLIKDRLDNPPEIVNVPVAQYREANKMALSNIALRLQKHLRPYMKTIESGVILDVVYTTDHVNTIYVVANSYTELRKQLEYPSSTDDVITAMITSQNQDHVGHYRDVTVPYLVERSGELLKEFNYDKRLDDKLFKQKMHTDLKAILIEIGSAYRFNISEYEEEKYKHQTNKTAPLFTEAWSEAVNALTLDELLDEWNSFLVPLICNTRFPEMTTAPLYINASYETLKKDHTVPKMDLIQDAVIEVLTETIVSSFKY